MEAWRRVSVFYFIALGGISALCVPLWLDPLHLDASYFTPLAIVMMWTPALAAVLTRKLLGPGNDGMREAFRWRKPSRPASSIALALLLPLGLTLGSMLLASALGVYPFDPSLSEVVAKTGGKLPMPALSMIALSVLSTLPGALINALPALGEELGWRGFLFHELRHVSPLRADITIGILWGLWHAPLVLLGYNYPTAPILGGLVLIPLMCIPLAIWIGWLTRRSQSVWVAALAHGAGNATATLAFLFAREGLPLDTVHATNTGWTGWILPSVFCLWLGLTGRLEKVSAREPA